MGHFLLLGPDLLGAGAAGEDSVKVDLAKYPVKVAVKGRGDSLDGAGEGVGGRVRGGTRFGCRRGRDSSGGRRRDSFARRRGEDSFGRARFRVSWCRVNNGCFRVDGGYGNRFG